MKTAFLTCIFALLILLQSQNTAYARPLVICTHLGFEPFVIKKGKSLKGIDIDIVLQILKNAKLSADIKAYSWKHLLSALKEGKCDIGFSLFDTEDRRQFIDYVFNAPVHYSTFSVFVKKGKEFKFNQISDFFGMRIAHNRGFAMTVGLEQAIRDGKIKRVLFDNVKDALHMLETNQIDAVLDNDARFRYYLKTQKKLNAIRALNVPFLLHRPAFLVISRKTTWEDPAGLKKILQTQLRKIHLDGTIQNINTKYLN
ncbi:MAG: amino acid ABC transporter substrate-binding protein [Methylocystaceae bacterium]|nr:amino acid ABC transporter substrate-binding protein [Methylocystaceae bacterium]